MPSPSSSPKPKKAKGATADQASHASDDAPVTQQSADAPSSTVGAAASPPPVQVDPPAEAGCSVPDAQAGTSREANLGALRESLSRLADMRAPPGARPAGARSTRASRQGSAASSVVDQPKGHFNESGHRNSPFIPSSVALRRRKKTKYTSSQDAR
jgi:hypothetical protein